MEKTTGNLMECKRCGTCCIKGGPSFHFDDRYLIEEGYILAKYLYTIRKGEPVCDNRINRIIFADTDIIKIKGQGNRWVCFFYKEEESKCEIYKHRPLECKALNCSNTKQIEKIFGKNLLTRKEIIGKIEGLWDMVTEHDQKCSYKEVTKYINEPGNKTNMHLSKEISELIEYDKALREIVVTKGGLEFELLEFLLGRPVATVINTLNEHFK